MARHAKRVVVMSDGCAVREERMANRLYARAALAEVEQGGATVRRLAPVPAA